MSGLIRIRRPRRTPAKVRPFHLTIVHPCVGRRPGSRSYMNTWKMEPIPAALISALSSSSQDCIKARS
mgnify:CR=1 FL=1